MQAYVEYNIGRRSRYYQSVMDIDSLSRGQSYDRLNDTFVIFICTYDPFGLGMQKYIFRKHCISAPGCPALDDGISTVILTDNDGDPTINEFFSYLKNTTEAEAALCGSRLVQLLNDKVQKVRFDPLLEVEYMKLEELQRERFNQGYESGVKQGIEQGTAEAQLTIIKNMLRNAESDEKIRCYTGCTAEQLEEIKKNLS